MKKEITKGGDFKCITEVLQDGLVKVLGAIIGLGNSVIENVIVEVKENA